MKKDINSVNLVCPVDQTVHEKVRPENDEYINMNLKHTYNDHGIFCGHMPTTYEHSNKLSL